MIELTIDQVKQHSASFLYIFADETAFLQKIKKEYAAIIRGKKMNQIKVLNLSAEKYGKTYQDYVSAVKQAFIDMYGISPANALVKLALGEEVAGKNWAKGVYGIGSLSTKFAGTDITVESKTGYLMRDGKRLSVYDTNYVEIKGKTVAYQLYHYDQSSGKTYYSQYNKTLKKYYAGGYSTSDGKQYTASGKEVSGSDGASIWGNITLGADWFMNILKWILSIFGITLPDFGSSSEMINEENTLPNQTVDGFVYRTGFGEAGVIAMALLVGGTLLATGSLNLKKSK